LSKSLTQIVTIQKEASSTKQKKIKRRRNRLGLADASYTERCHLLFCAMHNFTYVKALICFPLHAVEIWDKPILKPVNYPYIAKLADT